MFDEEKLIRTQQRTLLQIFCEVMLNSKVVLKLTIGPDDTGTNLGMSGLSSLWKPHPFSEGVHFLGTCMV